MTRRFTGWHMTAIMIAFFGVIITVNMTMAVFATRTFGGKVVENSYVASQQFNEWLAAARAQEKLGWKHELSLDGERKVVVAVSAPHRGEAFAACRALIDELKARVPIWKHQHFTDGTDEWVNST